jgi:hypothetical protein
MAITLIISDEKLQLAFEQHLDSLLSKGNYDNPVRKAFDNLLGWKGELQVEFQNQIKEMALAQMKTPEFAVALGKAMAEDIARREVDKLKKE